MRLPRPLLPPYDALEWERKPWPERVRMACAAWALQGYGTPLPVYAVYLVKIALYIAVWGFFCSLTPGLGGWANAPAWVFEPVAFQKAILWSMAFESLGLGCGSGPLSGHYLPPIGGFLHFARPGTTKLPYFQRLPLLGGSRRTWLDVALYLALHASLLRALLAPAPSAALLLPIVVVLPILGLADKTAFLSARPEHYYTTIVCFVFAGSVDEWIAGAMAVQLAIWIWAAVSKLTPHFPSVICVMTSNSPIVRLSSVRRAMYQSYPDDLRPSQLAVWLAHGGAVIEFGFPLVLAFGAGGPATVIGLIVMAGFHGYITSNFPMAVPIEWNVMVVYGAFFLFGVHADVSVWSIASPGLAAFLLFALVGVPVLGNLVPARASFLLSMRYYAGNWPFSVWLFRRGAAAKLDQHLVKASASVAAQLERIYDKRTTVALLGCVVAFRAMHLHGRALQLLLPKAVERMEDYEYVDGELVAGVVLGYNFGDGHLHQEQLLEAVQEQCHFEPGELRCVFVESQPLMLRPSLHWRVVDASTGLIEQGHMPVASLLERQPWTAP